MTAAGQMLPPVTDVEYKARVGRARAFMDKAGIGALLVTAEVNFRFLTGLVNQGWASPARPRYFLLPLEGEPVAIVPTGTRIAMRDSWVRDVRCWTAPCPEDDGISLLRDAIRATGAKRVGAELGPETRLGFPVQDFDRLRALLTPIEIVDGSPLLTAMRRVKSPAEIARIRFAARAVSAGFDALAERIRAGDTERTACRRLQIDLLERGLDRSPYMIAVSAAGGYETINTGPTDRVLQRGDLLIIDTGSTCDGYFCDFDRNYSFGPPVAAATDAYRRVWDATEAGLAVVRPGATASDVWRAMAEVLGGAEAAASANVGRMGHGLGLLLTEPPSIHPDDHTVLEAGMVITLEPGMGFVSPDGRRCVMVHEENVAVTETGCDLLSVRARPQPYLVG